MSESRHQGVMAMVNIDGGKVKNLREQKGLTQLYIATAVQVTTDTISRWENKRYPTIKKENAIRLAEALEVELEEILEEKEEESPEVEPVQTSPLPEPPATELKKKPLSLPLLFAFIACIIGIIAWWYLVIDRAIHQITATRSLPARYTINQPFPVTIEIVGADDQDTTLIIKEILPPRTSISGTEPELPKSGIKNGTLKWLHKVKGRMLFTYIATLSEQPASTSIFSGTIADGDNAEHPIEIQGNNTITSGAHHWADTDGDNVISDKEILTVYDQYGNLESLGIDIDLIEEIWLGSGYRWDPAGQSYTILP